MDIMQSFPSSYLRAGDLQGKTYKLVMKEVIMEDIGGDHKAVLYFQGADKGVVMNKTNASAISDAYGSDTDAWNGKEVEIFSAKVQFKGQTVDGIRMRAVVAAVAGAVPGGKKVQRAPESTAKPSTAPVDGSILDDAIPF